MGTIASLTWPPPQATPEPWPPTDLAVEKEWASISHTISGVLLPSLQTGLCVVFVLAGCVVINSDPQQAVGGGDGTSQVGGWPSGN